VSDAPRVLLARRDRGEDAYGSAALPQMRPRRAVSVDRLIEEYGPGIAMPDLRHELARCPHRRDMSDPCQVEYVDPMADL
jgi:hypothetical protein